MGTIAKITAGGSTHLVASTCYGTCSTAAATAAKVATIQDSQAFTLLTGVTIHIKFTYANGVANPTLNVNGTGAKSIMRYGTTAPGTAAKSSWNAGAVVSFTYDGTYWQINDWVNTDSNTTYSAGTGLSLSSTTFNHSNSVTAGTAGTSSATSGSSLAVPYVTYDAQGHITASGTHTHTVSGFLTSHQTVKQDGVTGATVNRYATCSTAAATAAKTASITTGTFSLEAGARVSVKFANANTASTPTLNINSTGAKNIFHKGVQITTGDNLVLLAGVVDFIYDGAQWHLVGNYIESSGDVEITEDTVFNISGVEFSIALAE